MLVEADHHAEIGIPGTDRRAAAEQRRASRGAPVQHVDERQRGFPELGDEGVGLAGRIRAAVRELHLRPAETCVGERRADRELTLIQAAPALGAAKGMDADTDDMNVRHGALEVSEMGLNAYVCRVTPSAASSHSSVVSSIGMPTRSVSKGAPMSGLSTINAAGNST